MYSGGAGAEVGVTRQLGSASSDAGNTLLQIPFIQRLDTPDDALDEMVAMIGP